MKKSLCLCSYLLIALFLTGIHPSRAAKMRTWTSLSGATVEARYIGMEQGEIILLGADGMEFTIRPDLLSESDQQYAREQLGIAPEPAPEPVIKRDEPAKLDSSQIPDLNLNQSERAHFIGFQTGGQPDDVVYFIFDHSTDSDRHDVFMTYTPGAPPHAQLQTRSGRNRRHEGEPYTEFETLTFTGQYGETTAKHTVTVSSGAVRADLIWARVESEYSTGRDRMEVHFAGTLNTDARTGHGIIPVVPMAMKVEPSIMASQRGSGYSVAGTLSSGSDFVLAGPRRLIESFVVELQDSDGNVLESVSVTANELPAFPRRLSWVYEASLRRVRPGRDYTVFIKGDLGPVIGPVQNQIRVSIQ